MIYAVLFEDNDGHADMRTRHMPDHLAFLQRNAASIQAAGPLQDSADNMPAGGLWLVRADNPQEVRTLIETDPFWPTGLRKSVRILEWRQVFAGGKRLI
jgi:uncharacterized protein YciI